MRDMHFILLVIGLSLGTAASQTSNYVTAETLYGTVRGAQYVYNTTGQAAALNLFLGIPYAEPPMGLLRLARPEPPSKWSGTRDALEFGNQCIQNNQVWPTEVDLPYSEDCLTLNIFSPPAPGSSAKLPVMVWIHGGGYIFGTGAYYNSTELALRGVIVVTINYRLDVLGFLSTTDSVIPGNFGMMDQVLALDWVKANIEFFGGDPNAVTIAGESAGASSVSLHLMSPLSRGKFHGAIMESGAALCPWATNPSNTTYYVPRDMAKILGLAVGCTHPESDQLLACLRTTSSHSLINASMSLHKTLKGPLLWTPVVETTFGFLPDLPQRLLAKTGGLADVPTIRGYNSNEMGEMVKDPADKGFTVKQFEGMVIANLYVAFQKRVPDVVADVMGVYLNNITSAKGRRAEYERMISDLEMVAPITFEAQKYSKMQKTSKTYLYEFAYRATFTKLPVWKGVVHTAELPFVFGLAGYKLKFNATDLHVAETMVTLWTNFVKTGNPTNPGISSPPHRRNNDNNTLRMKVKVAADATDDIVWPALNDQADTLLEITETPKASALLRLKAVDLWMVRIPKLQKNDRVYNIR